MNRLSVLGKNSEERPVHRLVQAIPSLIFTEGSGGGRGGGGGGGTQARSVPAF